jgi:hypothetical protein
MGHCASASTIKKHMLFQGSQAMGSPLRKSGSIASDAK